MGHPLNRIVTPTPALLAVRLHVKGGNQNLRGRPGATIIIPAIGMQDRSELKEHIAIVNERNPGREPVTQEQVEEAVEHKMKRTDAPPSVAALLQSGLRPGEHRRIAHGK